jgi:hypothetical protein
MRSCGVGMSNSWWKSWSASSSSSSSSSSHPRLLGRCNPPKTSSSPFVSLRLTASVGLSSPSLPPHAIQNATRITNRSLGLSLPNSNVGTF